MDKFKKKIKSRAISLIMVFLVLMGTSLILYLNQNKISSMPARIIGFNSGVLFGIGILLLIEILKNLSVMNNKNKLKKLYIKETDERTIMIMQKTGAIGMNICILGFGFAAIIAGFFNETVFFTLLATTLFTALVKGIFKVYYFKNS